DQQATYAQDIANALNKQGVRVVSDLRNEKISFKIREHTLQRVPYLFIVGDREIADKTVAVRSLSGEDKGAMSIEQCVQMLKEESRLLVQ
ncbi:MAG: His/Gly/Thr/Pro-type tRNA ligase C-terminal domain-containing protein, partial [Gammaproteobacteria bacterium]